MNSRVCKELRRLSKALVEGTDKEHLTGYVENTNLANKEKSIMALYNSSLPAELKAQMVTDESWHITGPRMLQEGSWQDIYKVFKDIYKKSPKFDGKSKPKSLIELAKLSRKR